jgi:outer membrane protein
VSLIHTDRPQLQLSLAEAIQLAVSKNLGTRARAVERIEALVDVESAKAGFDPQFQSDLSGSGSRSSTTSGLQSTGGQVQQKNYSLSSSLTQALPIGGSLQLSADESRADSNARFALLPTTYSGSLTAALSFPLLKNRGNRSLKTPIDVAKDNLSIAELQLRLDTINIIATVQNDYLDLVLARENLKIQQQSLDLAKNQREIAQAQERVGTLAPIEVLSADAEVAANEEQIIVAESAVLQAEDVLRTALNLPENLSMWEVGIIPTDAPGFPQEKYDFSEVVQQALKTRPDYQQALLGLKIQRLNLDLARDRVQPELDVSGSFGFLGNSQLGVTLGPDGQPTTTAQGGIFSSQVEDLLSFSNFQWALGFSVKAPLGNRAALGTYRVNKLEIEKAMLNLRNLELSILSQIRLTLRSIETNRERIAAAKVATELAKRRLEAEQKKFEVGTSTSFNVSQFQERYVAAETAETQAIIDLNRSVLLLQQAVGVTLEANGVRIENGLPVFGEATAAPKPSP